MFTGVKLGEGARTRDGAGSPNVLKVRVGIRIKLQRIGQRFRMFDLCSKGEGPAAS